jgi:hypothetical protein
VLGMLLPAPCDSRPATLTDSAAPRAGDRQVRDGEELAAVSPRRGSILVFPHATPHVGNCVGAQRKVLLRGDML